MRVPRSAGGVASFSLPKSACAVFSRVATRCDQIAAVVGSRRGTRRPLATLDRKSRQGRKAATVSIDAGAEVSRRGRLLLRLPKSACAVFSCVATRCDQIAAVLGSRRGSRAITRCGGRVEPAGSPSFSPRLTQAESCPASRRVGAVRHTLSCRGAVAAVSLDAAAEGSRRGRLPAGFRIAPARCFPARRRVGAMQDTLPCRTRPGEWAAARLTRNRIWSRFSHRAAHARAVAFPAFEPGALSRMPKRTHASNSSTSTTGAGAARCPSAKPPWLARALQRRPTRALHAPIAPCDPGRALCRRAKASRRIRPRPRGRRLHASPPCQAHAGPR